MSIRGRWEVESPIGSTIFTQDYPEGALSVEETFDIEEYSALVLVNGGIGYGKPTGRAARQAVAVVVVPGISFEAKSKFRDYPETRVLGGFLKDLANKFRTGVSIS
jgi:hypothetical protein